jgi:hypothetical protein
VFRLVEQRAGDGGCVVSAYEPEAVRCGPLPVDAEKPSSSELARREKIAEETW